MRLLVFLCCFFLVSWQGLLAQDAYHQSLQTELQADYSLNGGSWIFSNTEMANLNNATRYGGNYSTQDINGQVFSKVGRMTILSAQADAFRSGWSLRNPNTLQANDVILITFFLRSVGERGQVNFFAEDATTYAKEAFYTMPVDTSWRRYFVPIALTKGYASQGLVAGFHLGAQAQTIEIGGFTALDYGKSYSLEALPNDINNRFYEGWEPQADWRSEAAVRIDSLRKANLEIRTQTANGDPIANGLVEVKMLQHEFAFGSAVTADKIAGNNAYNRIYENKIIDLDGEGHGFNWVVFENDMKWPAWEQGWLVSKPELVKAVGWLRSHNIKIRGHTLVWPGNDNLPPDVRSNINDIPFVKNRINQHIEEILTWPGIAGETAEWDVINETVTNTSIETAFSGQAGYPTGREIYAEIFDKTRQVDSSLVLYINDYMTLSQQNKAGSVPYERLRSNIQELVAADVGIGGIGFQGHIGGFPNGIPDVLETLDDFYQEFGLTAKITEFDLPTYVVDTVAAAYLEDFLTAVFGHPSVDGFMFWNFWDGSTWRSEGSNLFNRDWSMTLPGETFMDLVFEEWWTEESLQTDANGVGTVRGFKGLYEITYTCDGGIVRDTVQLGEDLSLTINCDRLATDLDKSAQDGRSQIKVYPNPAQDRVFFSSPNPIHQVEILDRFGKRLMLSGVQTTSLAIDHLPAGVYVMRINDRWSQRFMKE